MKYFASICVLLLLPIELLHAAPDRQAPTVPTGLVSSGITQTGFTVSWTASTDNVGVTGYEVFLGGVSQGTVTTTSKVFSGLMPGTNYSVTVRARDAAANWSAQSTALPVTTTTDTSAPTTPSNLVATGVSSTGFTVTWTASTDNVGVTGYEVFLNGASQGTVTATSKAFSGLLPSTIYSVTARARDAAGNWSPQSSPLSVTTQSDTSAPSIPTGLASSAISSTGFTVSWGASTDNVAVTGYEIFLNAVSQGTVTATTKTITGLQAATTYSVTVRARDAAGNWSSQSAPLGVTTLSTVAANVEISAGGGHVSVLKSDGTVWGWGDNTCDGTNWGNVTPGMYRSPIQVPGIVGATSVSAGTSHTLVLKSDGTVLAFGYASAAIADGSSTKPISRLTGVKSVSAGGVHSLAVTTAGTIYAWGVNTNGQVGNAKTTDVTTPVQLSKVTGIVQAAAGGSHSLALKTDGTLLAWGANESGQLGTGNTTEQHAPIAVPGLTGVVKILAAGASSYALKSDGTVWAWGSNSSGQLGDGTAISKSVPTQIAGLSSAVSIVGSGAHVLVLKSDGTIWAWGLNGDGQLGDGTTISRSVPTRVSVVTTAIRVAAGGYNSFAVLADGTIRSWGRYSSGMLGDGGSTVLASPFSDVAQMRLGWNNDVFLTRADGSVWGWGQNTYGELADSTKQNHDYPTKIPNLSGIVQTEHEIALKSDGTVWTWGSNNAGQLGDGTLVDRYVPAQVPGLTGVIQVAGGSSGNSQFCMALKSDGTVWTWGDNTYGELGDGTNVNKRSPTQVPGLSGVVWIAAGAPNAFAVQSDGTSWAWGYDWYVFGAGTGVSTNVPIRTLVNNVKRISTNGRGHTLFLTNNGQVYICGNANMSAYGGAWFGSNYPLLVPGVDSAIEVNTTWASVARSSDGRIWRLSDSGPQLLTNVQNPTQVKSATGLGLLYNNGSVVFWTDANVPGLRPFGLSSIASQVADLRLGSTALDTDSDGLPDAWEQQFFGNLSHTAAADDDADGTTNIQEFLRGTNPTLSSTDGDSIIDAVDEFPADYYNGVPPSLAIVGGNNQQTEINKFNTAPFDVAVWSPDGSKPQVNAPVTFTVTSGGGLLAVDRSGSSQVSSSLNLLTDVDGTAHAFYQQPSSVGVVSSIKAQAGLAQVIFSTTSIPSQVDTDGDGLSDAQEAALGTNPNNPDTDGDGMPDGWEVANSLLPLVNDANADADGDGIKNIDEYRWNLNPQSSELSNPSALTRFEYNLKDEIITYRPVIGTAVTFTPDKEGNILSVH